MGEVLTLEAQTQINSFLSVVARSSESLLMLDYDGTLAPFRAERHQAFPYPGVAPLLQEIVGTGQTRVVIVSGRDTSETLPLLGIQPCPEVWGLHGLQRRRPDGRVDTVPMEERYLDALSDAERWLSYQQIQRAAEFKTGSIAIHWRGLTDFEAEELRGRALLGWTPIADRSGLELLEFDGGLEIRAPEADKGDVVNTLLSETPAGTAAAYLGDDATDEHAFQEIRGRGLSVLVRPRWRHTSAQLWLKPPGELLDFLRLWLEASRNRETRGGVNAVGVSG